VYANRDLALEPALDLGATIPVVRVGLLHSPAIRAVWRCTNPARAIRVVWQRVNLPLANRVVLPLVHPPRVIRVVWQHVNLPLAIRVEMPIPATDVSEDPDSGSEIQTAFSIHSETPEDM